MTDALYLAEVAGVALGDLVEITGDEGRHAATVKRTRVGEHLLVADGLGRAIRGEVVEVAKAAVRVRIDEVLEQTARPHQWVAVQGLAKGERSDIAVEALTELGADEIIAWQSERSVSRWDGKVDKGVAKWAMTARQATKQSRRFTVPRIGYAAADIVEHLADCDLVLVAHEEATTPLARIELPSQGRIAVVIGPEGGISERELERFVAAGAQVVSLGDGVLRTSTAGLVALAQLQAMVTLAD